MFEKLFYDILVVSYRKLNDEWIDEKEGKPIEAAPINCHKISLSLRNTSH